MNNKRLEAVLVRYAWKQQASYPQLNAIKRQFRAAGYHPAPKYGKGEWVHKNDCTIRSIRFAPTLGWHWVPSISRTLLIRAVRRDVAARS